MWMHLRRFYSAVKFRWKDVSENCAIQTLNPKLKSTLNRSVQAGKQVAYWKMSRSSTRNGRVYLHFHGNIHKSAILKSSDKEQGDCILSFLRVIFFGNTLNISNTLCKKGCQDLTKSPKLSKKKFWKHWVVMGNSSSGVFAVYKRYLLILFDSVININPPEHWSSKIFNFSRLSRQKNRKVWVCFQHLFSHIKFKQDFRLKVMHEWTNNFEKFLAKVIAQNSIRQLWSNWF